MNSKKRRRLYLLAALLVGLTGFYAYNRIPLSEFDAFAEKTIRELEPGNSGESIATHNVTSFLAEQGVADRHVYLSQAMNTKYEIQIDDPDISPNERNYLIEHDADKITVFSSDYHRRLLSYYEMRITIFEGAKIPPKIEAYIFLHSL